MLSLNEFENLIERPESSVLDFKKTMYDFDNDADLKKTGEFIKDIICFSNTIRTDASYIVIGIKEAQDKTKELHRLDRDVDDAILQDKVKSKVYPRPNFHYYNIIFRGLKFGIIEFPVTKYAMPISPMVKMKGLDPGKVYYRLGTSNTEASGLEVIKINDWLRSLPEHDHSKNKNDEVNKLLKEITASDKNLSSAISQIYSVAKTYHLVELLNFCTIELQGINENNRPDESEISYRMQNLLLSSLEISINPYFGGSDSLIKEELNKTDGVHEYKVLFSYPITRIEELLKGFKNSDKSIAVIKSSSMQLFPEKVTSDYTINIYVFPDNVISLIANIRQKAIDILMKS